MSPEREKGDFATGSSLLDNTKSELHLQGKRERRPILQKGCDFMFKHKTKIGAVILAMVTATALLSGCGADTAKEYDKHLKPETTVSVDKDADKVDDKKDSKESDKKADKADKQEDSKESSKPADKADNKDNGKKEDKPAENSKPSKPANSGAVNKPSTSKPSNPAPAPSKPAPSKPSDNTGNSSTNKPSTSKPAHQHNWKTEYKTVHHEAQYRNEPVYKDEIVYEDRPVYKWSAYWTCNGCGQRFNSENDVLEHVLMICGTGYTAHEEKVQTGTEQVQVGTNRVQVGTNPVLVKDAWDEQVKTGYTCSCGARK